MAFSASVFEFAIELTWRRDAVESSKLFEGLAVFDEVLREVIFGDEKIGMKVGKRGIWAVLFD